MISVFVIEDQTLVLEGLIRLLEFSDRIDVIGSAPNAEAALQQLTALKPDIVLVDIQLPGMNGIAFIKHFAQVRPATRYIVLTTFGEQRYLASAQAAGAHGFLLKDVSFAQLVSSIEKVHGGDCVFPEVNRLAQGTGEPEMQSLTAREQEIFTRIAQGLSNKEIARALSVSEGTIKNHVSNILSKLGVRDRTQAVIKYRSR